MITRAKLFAVIGDIVKSREVEDREALQVKIQSGLDQVNDRYVDTIAARFILTAGDEFQGLMTSPKNLDEIIALLRSAVHPTQLRFGIGFGSLSTSLRSDAIGMDGPCFYRARSAIENAKLYKILISVDVGKKRSCLDIYGLLYSQLRWGWTERQSQIIDLSMIGLSGKEISRKIGISASAVSQHRRAAGEQFIRRATELWKEVLLRLSDNIVFEDED